MRITIKVKTSARKESVVKAPNGTYLVSVNAEPVDGKANQALIELLANFFGVPKSSVRLVHGSSAKIKVFDVGF